MTVLLQIALLLAVPATAGLMTGSASIAFGATDQFGQLIADELFCVTKQTT